MALSRPSSGRLLPLSSFTHQSRPKDSLAMARPEGTIPDLPPSFVPTTHDPGFIPSNVDPGIINPCLLTWGCPWFWWESSLLDGGTPPNINTPGVYSSGVNTPITRSSREFRISAPTFFFCSLLLVGEPNLPTKKGVRKGTDRWGTSVRSEAPNADSPPPRSAALGSRRACREERSRMERMGFLNMKVGALFGGFWLYPPHSLRASLSSKTGPKVWKMGGFQRERWVKNGESNLRRVLTGNRQEINMGPIPLLRNIHKLGSGHFQVPEVLQLSYRVNKGVRTALQAIGKRHQCFQNPIPGNFLDTYPFGTLDGTVKMKRKPLPSTFKSGLKKRQSTMHRQIKQAPGGMVGGNWRAKRHGLC